MSKLIQTGRNPDWPKEVSHYWRYSATTPPPGWLTDHAKVIGFTDTNIALLETSLTGTGGLVIRSATGDLVTLATTDSWVLFDGDSKFLSMTNEQKELIYEEK